MIIIEGQKLLCKICGKEIKKEEAVFIPNFEANEKAPLSIFNDAIIHEKFLEEHPLYGQLNMRFEQL